MFKPEDTIKYIELAEKYGLNVSDENDVRDFIIAIRYNDQIAQGNTRQTQAEAAAAIGLNAGQVGRVKNTKKDIWEIALKIVMADFLSDTARADRRHEMFLHMSEMYTDALKHALEIASGQVRNDEGELLPDRQQPHYRERVAAFREVSGSGIADLWLKTQFLGDVTNPEEQEHLQLKASLVHRSAIRLDAPIEGELVQSSDQLPAQTTEASPPGTPPEAAADNNA